MFTELTAWFDEHGRDLPWREHGTPPWHILICEVMSQQTPVVRVLPAWREWTRRWPSPQDLAEARPDHVLRAWKSLGYPRRALRLRECAQEIVDRHGGIVPSDEEELLALPGIGAYTAAAVVAFGFGGRSLVLDTNIRRVIARLNGDALPRPSLTRAEKARAAAMLPEGIEESVAWNAATMELGALICMARAPRCEECPLSDWCEWRAAGYPPDRFAGKRRTQPWEGTMRQARGQVMAALRASHGPVEISVLREADPSRIDEALEGLVSDGLVVSDGTMISLPGSLDA